MVCRMAPIATDGAAAFIGEPSMPRSIRHVAAQTQQPRLGGKG